jgi:molybdenum cofactor biosynthesis enzyme MoaA
MLKHIPIYHQSSRLDRLRRNKDAELIIANHCQAPWRYLIVDWTGECFVCACEAWLPVSVGRIEQFDDLGAIWSSPVAREVQQDILDRQFSWCAIDMCGIQDHDIRYDKHTISINIDDSCNLRCPSCRTELKMLTEGPVFEQRRSQVLHLIDLLERFQEPCHIIMSGNGDVLASNIMRPLLHEYQPRPDHTFRLFTNGLLLKKQLSRSRILPQTTQYQISIDAGSAQVYEQVRLGGKWSVLQENFDFLSSVIADTGADVWLMFVVQQTNWHDMRNFAELCVQRGWHGNITKLVDWGTWQDFDANDVIGNTQHPDHLAAMQELMYIDQFNPGLVHLDDYLKNLIQ